MWYLAEARLARATTRNAVTGTANPAKQTAHNWLIGMRLPSPPAVIAASSKYSAGRPCSGVPVALWRQSLIAAAARDPPSRWQHIGTPGCRAPCRPDGELGDVADWRVCLPKRCWRRSRGGSCITWTFPLCCLGLRIVKLALIICWAYLAEPTLFPDVIVISLDDENRAVLHHRIPRATRADEIVSFLIVALNDSAAALWSHMPVCPTDGIIPSAKRRSRYLPEVFDCTVMVRASCAVLPGAAAASARPRAPGPCACGHPRPSRRPYSSACG